VRREAPTQGAAVSSPPTKRADWKPPSLGSGSLPTPLTALQGHFGSELPRSFSARLPKRTGSPRRIRPVADCHPVLPRWSRSHLRLSSGSG